MPDEMKNYITHKCFDACFGEFKDKNLNMNERNCMKTCVENFMTVPKVYQQTQQFEGFVKKETP